MNTRITKTNRIVAANKVRPHGGDFFMPHPAQLILADGTRFDGTGLAWQQDTTVGEVVFNTGMTGYTESLTDPSYANQILVFTFPLIGNYGVSHNGWESEKVHVKGVIVSEACTEWSHSSGMESLVEWLGAQGVPVLTGVDTRALTKHLRSRGTMLGAITEADTFDASKHALEPARVSIPSPILYNEQYEPLVIAVDCGMKQNILEHLLALPVRVKRVPFDYDYTNEEYVGVLLSNGPGDPTDYPETIAVAQKAIELGRPMFGICLGNQIMGLAAGGSTFKLPFGHRGHNQPCLFIDGSDEKRCFITSQNHGYALDADSLPADWQVSFRNLNDDSVEGIAHRTKPFFAVQFHPEANPGPTDTKWLFERFYGSL